MYSYPIIHPPVRLFIFYTVCILRRHRNSSDATNMNFGFQLAKGMDYMMVKTKVGAIVFYKVIAVS